MMRTYTVEVSMHSGLSAQTYSAKSPAAARAAAWRDFTSAWDCTFKDFLRISRVRACPVPADDGYAYVRRNYGVDPKVGARCRLVNEGPSTGLEGEVVYPGPSTAHVHVRLDGRDHNSIVHPSNIQFI
jgi:hypothetical protein